MKNKYNNYMFLTLLLIFFIHLIFLMEYKWSGLSYSNSLVATFRHTFIVQIPLILIISFFIGRFKFHKEKISIVSFYVYIITLLELIYEFYLVDFMR